MQMNEVNGRKANGLSTTQVKEAKRKHYDLIVQWAKDTTQKVCLYDKAYVDWTWTQSPVWESSFDYKTQENKPTEPPVKKVSFFDGGIEFDCPSTGCVWVFDERNPDNKGISLCFYTGPGGSNVDVVREALLELMNKRLNPKEAI